MKKNYDHSNPCQGCAIGLSPEEHKQVHDLGRQILTKAETASECIEEIENLDIPERMKLLLAYQLGTIVGNQSPNEKDAQVAVALMGKGGHACHN